MIFVSCTVEATWNVEFSDLSKKLKCILLGMPYLFVKFHILIIT